MPQALSPELRALQGEIEGYAREYGLDFFEVIFEVVDWEEINEIAAYGGYPLRYPHWRFGMEYYGLAKSYAYGLSKIYEMVINNDPCYAYLLAANHWVDQKLVMAHVYAHCDFFKQNYSFAFTNRKMVDEMANHAARIRRHMEVHGENEVEGFLDRSLSLDNLIDYNAPYIVRRRAEAEPEGDEPPVVQARKLVAKEYLDEYINPPEVLAEETRRRREEHAQAQERFPKEPEKDVLLFLLEHAPLANWQRDILGIVREEAYYFAPQGRTKILNEGWASFWHSRIMTERALTDAEVVDYADHHSATVAPHPGRLNPYKLGLELVRDVEERWNKGRFGPEWESCDDFERKRSWDTAAGLGREKIFEVRKMYNDVTFIDEFLTPEFCERQNLFAYAWNESNRRYEIVDRSFEKVKEHLLFNLTNFGQPWIYVRDGNFLNRGELVLWHRYEGVPLRFDYAREVLESLHRIWRRPVHIETHEDEKPIVLSYDGTEHKTQARAED